MLSAGGEKRDPGTLGLPQLRWNCLQKLILCHSEKRSDEESWFLPATGRTQIPRFARDDNS
jgi:hypothetical protein